MVIFGQPRRLPSRYLRDTAALRAAIRLAVALRQDRSQLSPDALLAVCVAAREDTRHPRTVSFARVHLETYPTLIRSHPITTASDRAGAGAGAHRRVPSS